MQNALHKIIICNSSVVMATSGICKILVSVRCVIFFSSLLNRYNSQLIYAGQQARLGEDLPFLLAPRSVMPQPNFVPVKLVPRAMPWPLRHLIHRQFYGIATYAEPGRFAVRCPLLLESCVAGKIPSLVRECL